MNRSITTIDELWKEWSTGLLVGDPSIQYLELKYKAKWRSDPKERSFFCRRKKIIDYIVTQSHNSGISEDQIAICLDKWRTSFNPPKSLDWLQIKSSSGTFNITEAPWRSFMGSL
jgi:hypothetical protein